MAQYQNLFTRVQVRGPAYAGVPLTTTSWTRTGKPFFLHFFGVLGDAQVGPIYLGVTGVGGALGSGGIGTGGASGRGGVGGMGGFAGGGAGGKGGSATGGTVGSGGAAGAGGCTGTMRACNGACIAATECCGGCTGNTPVCSNGTCVKRSMGDGCNVDAECGTGHERHRLPVGERIGLVG